ncbi:MAG: excinuclease ABC subunit UvrA, partial [Mycobacteriales bacterium]
LSGGEAQRVKLASELQKRQTGRTIYVLDEPTTGLHFEDIRKLLVVLGRLVDQGNSVVVIEHNLDVIKTADWVIDMGPEGGSGGGTVVAQGTPEHVATVEASHTGRFLREILAGRGATAPAKPAARTGSARTGATGTGAKGTGAKGTSGKGTAGKPAKAPARARATAAR